MKKQHLRFDYRTAFDCGIEKHAQTVMKDLGIKYQHATPQSIADQWWFWNCIVTNDLPDYLEVLNVDPLKMVGFGLTLEDAEAIAKEAI